MAATAAGTPGPIGYVDTPVAEAVIGTAIRITGWALDSAGIDRVEVRWNGTTLRASYGLARADVAAVMPGYPDGDYSGFEFEANLAPLGAIRQRLAIVAVSRSGVERVLAFKSVIPNGTPTRWQALSAARHPKTPAPFYILPALSGVSLGGAAGLDQAYVPYASPTVQIGMRVPILYLRTTLGAARDWLFDPDWEVERRLGDRRIADDSLSGVIAHSIGCRLPVLLTLNGGIWADAACSAPEWDVNDHLEEDEANCQWNEHDQVMPESRVRHLPGTVGAPEIGRSLTFNCYAARNRHYKKRNLQAAGRIVADFARAHPDLFVGVNVDPDTYMNPFFEEEQRYDYNPGTLRQFREWLAGMGPYAGNASPGVPDLSRHRRAQPLSLAEVSRLAGRSFASWSAVDAPRVFPRGDAPYWEDAWTREWEIFRRHLVHLHYDELSEWLAEVGIPPARIFSSQGFVAPYPSAMPFAVAIDSPIKNYDGGGMSIQGAIPSAGHLGAILYGAGALNDVRMEAGTDNLFATFHGMDRGWAVVEFNTADFRTPHRHPTYAEGYRALREMFNYGARFVSPMAWNGWDGRYAGQSGYAPHTAWRNTPLEDAACDFALSHAFLPAGARLWTFGTPRYVDDDGWSVDSGSSMVPGNGHLEVTTNDRGAALVSPSPLALARGEIDLLVLGVAFDAVESVSVDARAPTGAWTALAMTRAAKELESTSAGLAVPLAWPSTLDRTDQIRISLEPANTKTMRIAHVALYPAADRADRA